MKKDLSTHFIFWLVYFVAIILLKHLFDWSVVPFVIGGLIGVVLPDIDHIIYVYFIKPTDLSSQRINYLVNKSELKRSVELLYETRSERRDLVFHTLFFQAIFFVLTFWILTSSGSLLGSGLALSFMLHLSVDQFIDLRDPGSLDTWFKYVPFRLNFGQSQVFWVISTSIVLLMGLMV